MQKERIKIYSKNLLLQDVLLVFKSLYWNKLRWDQLFKIGEDQLQLASCRSEWCNNKLKMKEFGQYTFWNLVITTIKFY